MGGGGAGEDISFLTHCKVPVLTLSCQLRFGALEIWSGVGDRKCQGYERTATILNTARLKWVGYQWLQYNGTDITEQMHN
jgi:hypothetical protein